MASPKTIEMKRNQMLSRALSIKDVTPLSHQGPNHAQRRKQIQNWCRHFNVPYNVARAAIKEEEEKMRAKGIDPWDPKARVEATPNVKKTMELFTGDEVMKGEQII